MKTFGQILREKRKAKGWKQYKLAEMLNVRVQTITNWERDLTVPNVYMAADIAQVLGCTIDELIRGKEE